MSEQQGRKRGSAMVPCAVVKRERVEEGDASQGSCEGSRAAAAAVELEAMDEPQLNLMLGMSLLHCQACLLPLKPPTFKCQSGHVVCCTCRGKHGEACGGRAATFAACPELDAVVRDAKLPCQNEEFGCKSLVVYYQADDHHGACPWAPCFCPATDCDFFSSPARLAEHLLTHHLWPVTTVRYGAESKIPVPAPGKGFHVLVGEGGQSVFLVCPSALGAATALSLVCARANGAGGQFKCRLRVEVPSNKEQLTLKMPAVRSGDLDGGLPTVDTDLFLAVPSVLLHDASGEAPNLFVCIDKADVAAANSTPPMVE